MLGYSSPASNERQQPSDLRGNKIFTLIFFSALGHASVIELEVLGVIPCAPQSYPDHEVIFRLKVRSSKELFTVEGRVVTDFSGLGMSYNPVPMLRPRIGAITVDPDTSTGLQ